mmetsp:Transcript_49540/g.85156  ORF Transcript_49540/g.85156 Transcript_49540/m.85156 type:complete len:563 (+) Transcript_49540:456-2144(+)
MLLPLLLLLPQQDVGAQQLRHGVLGLALLQAVGFHHLRGDLFLLLEAIVLALTVVHFNCLFLERILFLDRFVQFLLVELRLARMLPVQLGLADHGRRLHGPLARRPGLQHLALLRGVNAQPRVHLVVGLLAPRARAVGVALQRVAAAVAPPHGAAVVVGAPHARVVVLQHVLLVLGPGHRPRGPLHHPAVAAVHDVVLGLPQGQPRVQRAHRLLPAVLLQHLALLRLLVRVLLFLELLLGQLGLRGVGLHVDLLPALLRLPRVQLGLGEVDGLPGGAHPVVAGVQHLVRVRVRERVRAHRPGLGVVEGRVGVQVAQVLGRVLADAQVAHGLLHLRAAHAALPVDAPLEVLRVLVPHDEILGVILILIFFIGLIISVRICVTVIIGHAICSNIRICWGILVVSFVDHRGQALCLFLFQLLLFLFLQPFFFLLFSLFLLLCTSFFLAQSPALRIHEVEFFNSPLLVGAVVAMPAVALGVVGDLLQAAAGHVHHALVRLDVHPRLPRRLFIRAGALHALGGLVRHRAAVAAGAFAVAGCALGFHHLAFCNQRIRFIHGDIFVHLL